MHDHRTLSGTPAPTERSPFHLGYLEHQLEIIGANADLHLDTLRTKYLA